MKSKDFFAKLFGRFLWGNILAMGVVVVLVCVGVWYGLDVYTHHGEEIPVPNVLRMDAAKAQRLLEQDGLRIAVSDSGYNKMLPPDCVLAQNPSYGAKVKSGHVVYVTVNSAQSPTLAIPDVVDNSSVREASARLRALGFRLLDPKYVTGEKDWVYGIECGGRRVSAGERVSIESPLTLVVGGGTYDSEDEDISYTDPELDMGEAGDVDDFEEVTVPQGME